MRPNRKTYVLNQLINLFWTGLAFIPIWIFWWNAGINQFFWGFLGAAVIFSILPEKLLKMVQLSNNQKFYEKLGVKIIRKFVQNGDWMKSSSGKMYNPAINNISKAKTYLKTINMYERFHWLCFIFFFFSSIYTICMGEIMLGFSIFLCNLIYNVTVICLQQYNKLRILNLLKYK